MMKSLKVRWAQGKQYVPDVRKAQPTGFRGLPVIQSKTCPPECQACLSACPAEAIRLNPLSLDLGACVFCGECAVSCPERIVTFSEGYQMASDTREGLWVSSETQKVGVAVSKEIARRFGRSLKLRSVSAGGCNACELEMNALSNVNFDIGRFGIDFVASPRHADGLVLTGPITQNMSEALQLCYDGMPDPKFIIAVGACAISGGLFANASGVDRAFLNRFKPQLYVPGCPPHPLTFLNGILDLLGR